MIVTFHLHPWLNIHFACQRVDYYVYVCCLCSFATESIDEHVGDSLQVIALVFKSESAPTLQGLRLFSFCPNECIVNHQLRQCNM